MIRKTVLTTAIVGAGLASTAGAAFAGDAPSSESSGSGHHHGSSHSDSSKGCSNTAAGEIDNKGAKTLVGILDGSQGALGLNLCDNLNNNKVLSGNHISIAGQELPQPPTS